MTKKGNSDIFYCYSNRLHYFLQSVKFRYIESDINENTNKIYWTYKKSDNLTEAIQFYNTIKYKFN